MKQENKKSNGYTYQIRLNKNITRVVHTMKKEVPRRSCLIAEDFPMDSQDKSWTEGVQGPIRFVDEKGKTILSELSYDLKEKKIYSYEPDSTVDPLVKQTANGEVSCYDGSCGKESGQSYEGKVTFGITEEECLYGLGQHENGVYNFNGTKEYLYQANQKITIPFLISSKNYGILLDTETDMIFESGQGKMSFWLDTTEEISYYVIVGENFESIIRSLRLLTGKAVMLPRWAFGYIQSKERYHSAEELCMIAKRFREEGIPLDALVQDWLTWKDGLWGEKTPDPVRFPSVKKLMEELHQEHVRLIVSIWPSMSENGENYQEMQEKGFILPNSNIYNAYEEEARKLYWKQCEQGWFSGGIDAWWGDSTEPFSDPDWNGATKRPEEERYGLIVDASKRSIDWHRINTYGLMHAKGIYENWRNCNKEKRVLNITRSTYTSGQKYGVVPWSGDTSASWATLKRQIVEGIQFSLSGMPYWHLDVGAFFSATKKEEPRLWFWNGDYDEGVNDLGYRELYVRWLQYATFLPMLRSHGTDTPREPWNFGKPGEVFYDTILKFIRLRYRLLPYIYSLAAQVYLEDTTMLRSLMFDFADDERVHGECQSFMLGKSLLVCPVTEPMYYGANSEPFVGKEKKSRVYLPKGVKWYDYWTDVQYEGGQEIECDAPIERLPLFVRAGAILPISDDVTYADERQGQAAEIVLYCGADGQFTLYYDEGDNYSYEQGNYASILIKYCEKERTLTFEKVSGNFTYPRQFKIRVKGTKQSELVLKTAYEGSRISVHIL